MPDALNRRLRDDRGEVTATVIVVPVVLLAMLLVVQFGLAYYARQVLAGAAQDGAAAAARRDSPARLRARRSPSSWSAKPAASLLDSYHATRHV